jgi:DNA invertase Pin-like site-specific DNA recombinase
MWAALVRVSTDDQDCTRQRRAIRQACQDETWLERHGLAELGIPADMWFEDYESRDQ